MPPTPTPSDSYATLKSAVLGAQANTAPGASPLGSFPELSKLYSSGDELSQTRLASAAPNYNTGVQVSNDAQAAAEARASAAAKASALSDPSKYKQVQKADGGYAFYDPFGNEISASAFAAIHNSTPADILKNSQNPIDKAYIQDFNQLQNYINNKNNAKNDPAARSAAQATETQIRKVYGIDIHQQNPLQVIQAFQMAYPTVYGGTGPGAQGSAQLLPNAAAEKASKKVTVGGGGPI